MYNQLVIF